MNNKIYVGNLSYSTENTALESLFAQHGEVKSCKIITDRDTGRSKGFAFVEMGDESQASSAIDALNQSDFDGRTIKVNQAQEKPRRSGPPRDGGFNKRR